MSKKKKSNILIKTEPKQYIYYNEVFKLSSNETIKNTKSKLNNIIIKLINIKFFTLLIITNLIQILSSNNNNKFSYQLNFSNITLKIKGKGYKNILNNNYDLDNYPNEITINSIAQNSINFTYYFNQTINIVELIWNYSVNNCISMFSGCSDITEIDLSNFDSSLSTNMSYMFNGCSSLSSLNLLNFNSSQSTDMSYMFYE